METPALTTIHLDPSEESGYIFDNAAAETESRFGSLATIYDGVTFGHLRRRGVGPGWKCLEVGGGNGSIAVWLSKQVGRNGQVVATDLDTRYLTLLNHPLIEVRRHDISIDPLENDHFDLVHTRLVLVHVSDRDGALRKMVAATKPGGWLVFEEFDARWMGDAVLPTYAAMQQLMKQRGVDSAFGRSLPSKMIELGLSDTGNSGYVFQWHGESAFSQLLRANFDQVRDAMLEAGLVSERQFNEDVERLDDPELILPTPILWSAWGRKPV
jgi:SAM-dependent methyltransferase